MAEITENTQMSKEGGDSVHQEEYIAENEPVLEQLKLQTLGNIVATQIPKKGRKPKVQVQDKATDAQALIEALQEKIILIGYIAEGKTVTPSELSVKGRELYQEYEKAVQDMKNGYIAKIQAL